MYEIEILLRPVAMQVKCKAMGKDGSTTCPAGCQDAIDATYADCGGTCTLIPPNTEWDVVAAAWAATITTTGCSGAVAAAPVFALVAAAMTFFN